MRTLEMVGGNQNTPRPDDIVRVVVYLGALILTLGILAGCGRPADKQDTKVENTTAPVKKAEQPAHKPDKAQPASAAAEHIKQAETRLKISSRKISLTWAQNGQTKLEATAIELTGDTAAGTAAMKSVSASLYDKGKIVAKMAAPLVMADEKTRIVTATGGVTITSTVPESTIKTVKAQWIKWYLRQDKLVGNGGIHAQGPVSTIDAAAFVADTRLKTIRIVANPEEARAVVGQQ